jgi:hypothetical protein
MAMHIEMLEEEAMEQAQGEGQGAADANLEATFTSEQFEGQDNARVQFLEERGVGVTAAVLQKLSIRLPLVVTADGAGDGADGDGADGRDGADNTDVAFQGGLEMLQPDDDRGTTPLLSEKLHRRRFGHIEEVKSLCDGHIIASALMAYPHLLKSASAANGSNDGDATGDATGDTTGACMKGTWPPIDSSNSLTRIGMGADDDGYGDPRPQSLAMVCGSLRLLMANAKDSVGNIDVGAVMGSMVDETMRKAASRTKSELGEQRQLLRAWDSVFHQEISARGASGATMQEELKHGLLSVAEQVVPLYAINKGYCLVGEGEERGVREALEGGSGSALLEYIRRTSPTLLEEIDSSRQLSPSTLKTLDANLRVFFSLLHHGAIN